MEPLEKRFKEVENSSRIGYLIGGFITETLSIEEREELDAWVLSSDRNMQLFEDLTEEGRVNEFMLWLATSDVESRLSETRKRLRQTERPVIRTYLPYAAAACLLIAAMIWYGRSSKQETGNLDPVVAKKDIEPGAAIAELRLPDGRRIQLGESRDTTIDNIQIEGALLKYLGNNSVGWHEVIIPKKGFFKLELPDGTKVWLNSVSSIKYPGSFSGKTREVSVTGETYFEIAVDKQRPFIVTVGAHKIQAVGTAFNVNEFDESITLVEGVVRVKLNNEEFSLRSGEQLGFNGVIKNVQTGYILAWTKNEFRFHNQTINEIKPLLERWYDANLVIKDSIGFHFNGTIERTVPISRVLELLQATGHLRFQINDNSITVTR